MSSNRVVTILISIILAIVLVSIANVGMTLFFNEPRYDDFCTNSDGTPLNRTETKPFFDPDAAPITCDQAAYDAALKSFNQYRFYIFGGIGLVLVLLGLFIPVSLIQWSLIPSGGVLIAQAIVMNFANKLAVFISLIVILLIIAFGAYRALRR